MHRLKRAPRQSTAATYHGVPASSITYFGRLTVHHPELRSPLEFCLRDHHHGALVLPTFAPFCPNHLLAQGFTLGYDTGE